MMNDGQRGTKRSGTPLPPDSRKVREGRFEETRGAGPGSQGKKKWDIDTWLEKITRLIDFF